MSKMSLDEMLQYWRTHDRLPPDDPAPATPAAPAPAARPRANPANDRIDRLFVAPAEPEKPLSGRDRYFGTGRVQEANPAAPAATRQIVADVPEPEPEPRIFMGRLRE